MIFRYYELPIDFLLIEVDKDEEERFLNKRLIDEDFLRPSLEP